MILQVSRPDLQLVAQTDQVIDVVIPVGAHVMRLLSTWHHSHTRT